MEHTNLRERLTKKLIEEAFLDLVNEGGMHAATVSSICKRAQINRSTFYRHFDNQYQLLEAMEERLMARIDGQELSGFLCNPSPENLRTCLSITEESFRAIQEDSAMYCILATKVHPGLFEKFFEGRRAFIFAALLNRFDEKEAQRITSFIVAGSSAIMKAWTCDESREPPKQVTELVIKMCQAAIAAKGAS